MDKKYLFRNNMQDVMYLEARKIEYYTRVAEAFGLTDYKQGNDLVRLYSSLKKVSTYVDDIDGLLETMLERISMNEPIIPRKEK
ncbi:hypothetical protein CN680_09265 [Bacillus pseudomycoides]|nr:hypothetical protein [Bacillus pseudomycoides]PEI45048.1 hypothetical protein CN620_02985 [Bacillus pseudomycoides]PEJ79522.1 hypothetical protein CN680_09265 [Bacillus pseudomycoides]PEM20025.1 hypothetical protein CN628_04480 [Bacillus pseudomycoides]PEO99646.1 hypothetical protein CN550_11075 [Bacillus pseudomycoides]PGA24687.1 hypothetical protein COL79_09225 [Bacillus pseudomycoides]